MFKSLDFVRNLVSDSLFIVGLQDALEKTDFSFRRENDLERDPERSLSIHMVSGSLKLYKI